jgi:hypothetical protein
MIATEGGVSLVFTPLNRRASPIESRHFHSYNLVGIQLSSRALRKQEVNKGTP